MGICDGKLKNPTASEMGRKGGVSGTGSRKARTPEQARAAVMVRWAKAKANKENSNEQRSVQGETGIVVGGDVAVVPEKCEQVSDGQ